MKIRISNLIDTMSEEDILDLFKKYGKTANLRVIPDRYIAKNSLIAFVDLLDEKKVAIAVRELSELVIGGEQLKVKLMDEE
tara:strand:+ start:149 stop:391 length:243 start_codon:yes stop_codon:yes gene_type:complete